jgi:hypothetical protein
MKYPAVVTVLLVNIQRCSAVSVRQSLRNGQLVGDGVPQLSQSSGQGWRGQKGKRYRTVVDVLGEGAESSVFQLNARSVGVFCSSVVVSGEHAGELRMCVSTQNCLNDLDSMGVPSRLQ